MKQATLKRLKILVVRDLVFLAGGSLLPIFVGTYDWLVHRQSLHISMFLTKEFPYLILFGLPVFHGLSWYSLRKRSARAQR